MQIQNQPFLDLIDNRVNQIKKELPSIMFYPSNQIISIKRVDETISINGLLVTARGRIKHVENTIDFDVSIKNIPKISILFFSVILFPVLFMEGVTVNGNDKPSIIERTLFIILGIVLLSVPFIILFRSKTSFKLLVEKEFKDVMITAPSSTLAKVAENSSSTLSIF